MKAIVRTNYGGPEVLQFKDVPMPELRPRDVLVRVQATALNPVDTKRRRGPGDPLLNQILGWDAAGIVERLGSQATRFNVGDQVYFAGDVTRPGSNAEYVAVDERIVGHKPKRLTFAEAAAIPLTALTVCEAFSEQMGIPLAPASKVQTMLIVGGAGGVGSIAIQIAKRVCQLHVVATSSRAESTAFCKQLGADDVVDHTRDLTPQFKALGLSGADYILNTWELTNLPQLAAVLNPLGKICAILGGPATQCLDASAMVAKRGTLTFELMFTRPRLNLEPERQGAILARVADWLDEGVIKTTMTRQLDWNEVQEAHRAIETGHTMGKIVLNVNA